MSFVIFFYLFVFSDWSPIEVEDALELLSPAFTHPGVREYAVNRLFHSATPEQVHLYLPQLVQALKYEPYKEQDVTKVIQVNLIQLFFLHERCSLIHKLSQRIILK